MEILNNIWNALSTENEWMIKIISIPCSFIEVYLTFCLFSTTLKTKHSKTQKTAYIFIVSVISILCSFIPEPYNVFANYIVMLSLLKWYLKYTVLQCIGAILIPFAVFGLVSSLILNPFIKLFNTTYNTFSVTPIYRITYLIVYYIISYVIVFILKYWYPKVEANFKYDKKTFYTILVSSMLGILTLIIQTFMTVYYYSTVPIIFTLFNFVLLFAYFFTSFYSLTKAMKLDITTRNLENAESYNNSLTVLYDNVRGFKHDFDNMVNIIGGYIQVNDIKGLKHYYNSLQKDCSKVRNVQMLNPNIINNPGIYNLIVSKYKKATDVGVTINFEFFFDFDNLHMPIYEFSRILGILLDNAIEAAKDCEEQEINLVFRESRKQQVQIIIIENTYSDKNIDTTKIFEKGISGKENHSGIGLWEVNKIVMNYNNIVLKTSKDNNFFRQELQIYY